MVHYVYILKCADGDHYTGIAKNLKKRLEEHNTGLSSSTSHRLPAVLIWFCGFITESDAVRFEKYLKSHSGRRFRDRFLSD
jgi:putative endonuclease